eukprot:TRINITY_DN77780_c0_g1_i1.p1 TRINITY_DN77780_c0_g1~~TRINITY_DN77780_c0_g1_i1.p1  ORF type:complete len:276 (-),score=21.53 TRINITY_DN77780_c0_g1_i1:730-1557(-)
MSAKKDDKELKVQTTTGGVKRPPAKPLLTFDNRSKFQMYKRCVGCFLALFAIPLYIQMDWWLPPGQESPIVMLNVTRSSTINRVIKSHKALSAAVVAEMKEPECAKDEACMNEKEEQLNKLYQAKECLIGNIECDTPKWEVNQTTLLLWVLLALWCGYCFYPMPDVLILDMVEFGLVEHGDVFTFKEFESTVTAENTLQDKNDNTTTFPNFREWSTLCCGTPTEKVWGHQCRCKRTDQTVAELVSKVYELKAGESREEYIKRTEKRPRPQKRKRS